MMEMLTGQPPYPCRTFQEIILMQRQEKNRAVPISPALRAKASPACLDLLEALLEKTALKRISFSEFFAHPWLDLMADLLAELEPVAPLPSSSPAPSSGASVSVAHPLDSELLEALRSIERALPTDEEHPSSSLFENPSSLTGENLSKIIWRINSLSQEYRTLKEESKRPRIMLTDLRIGDRVMFSPDKTGSYVAFGNFRPLHVLSIESMTAFQHEISRKDFIFGIVVYLQPPVRSVPGNPYHLQPDVEYVAVTLAADPLDDHAPRSSS
jgi:serine/threonine protein kinase